MAVSDKNKTSDRIRGPRPRPRPRPRPTTGGQTGAGTSPRTSSRRSLWIRVLLLIAATTDARRGRCRIN
eukprot:9472303-Pyramimonas_sp.AAC.1